MSFRIHFYGLVAALLASARPGHGQAAEPAAVAQATRLAAAGQYETAYQLLDKADPHNQQPAVLLAKEKLLLDNYLITLGFQGFGLRNLAPGETVAQLRGQEGQYSMHLLDIPQQLTQLQKRFPQDYRLRKGLGDYYYRAMLCRCGERDKSEAALLKLVLANYGQAHAHQLGDYMSYYAVGYAYLVQSQSQASIAPFRQSIALKPDYPDSHYNLGYALLHLHQPAEALPHAQAALRLYTDPALKADAARMVGQLYRQQHQPAEARQALLQSLELQPDSYPSLRSLLELAVETHAPDAASWAARVYQLNPADDQMFADILDIYQAQNQWDEALAFFTGRLPTAPAEPAAQGLLHFYIAILHMQLKQPREARPHFLAAQTQLRQVAQPDNPLFQLIDKGLAETKP